jgi:hypothetical protein
MFKLVLMMVGVLEPLDSVRLYPRTPPIDVSQYRRLLGFSLLYTYRVPIELLDSAALICRESCGGGGQIVFLNLTTIIKVAALSTIHDVKLTLVMRYL